MDIQPGTTVKVEIAKTPTNAGATKTLYRLCRKDPEAAHRLRWTKRNRPSWQTKRRGGRWWHHQMKSKPGVSLSPGKQYSILATVDVLRDLESVERFVKVSPA
jgi:hypothetical protein